MKYKVNTRKTFISEQIIFLALVTLSFALIMNLYLRSVCELGFASWYMHTLIKPVMTCHLLKCSAHDLLPAVCFDTREKKVSNGFAKFLNMLCY